MMVDKELERGREPVGSVTAFKNSVQIDAGDFWQYCATIGLQTCPAVAPVQTNKRNPKR